MTDAEMIDEIVQALAKAEGYDQPAAVHYAQADAVVAGHLSPLLADRDEAERNQQRVASDHAAAQTAELRRQLDAAKLHEGRLYEHGDELDRLLHESETEAADLRARLARAVVPPIDWTGRLREAITEAIRPFEGCTSDTIAAQAVDRLEGLIASWGVATQPAEPAPAAEPPSEHPADLLGRAFPFDAASEAFRPQLEDDEDLPDSAFVAPPNPSHPAWTAPVKRTHRPAPAAQPEPPGEPRAWASWMCPNAQCDHSAPMHDAAGRYGMDGCTCRRVSDTEEDDRG